MDIYAIRDSVISILSHPTLDAVPTFEPDFSSETCANIVLENCPDSQCPFRHFEYDLRASTEMTAGLCSYMDLCTNGSCKFVHLKPVGVSGTPSPAAPLSSAQWINADIRSLDLGVFRDRVSAVLIDPPWDIHMELSYGTMTDDEMRNLPVERIHVETGGLVFLWATTRTLETARQCLFRWGYERVEEIIWVKTNQVGGTVRSGRTGHWFNHSKEHCLVGAKGGDLWWTTFGKYRTDCDVIVAPVRENSRKPDEMYGIIERMVQGADKPCLELFGRTHNRRNNWITVGNQLEDTFWQA